MNAGSLTIDIAANVARLQKDMNEVRGIVQKTGKQFETFSGSVAMATKAFAGMTAAIYSMSQAWKMVKVGAEFDEQRGILNNLSKQYKTSADEIVKSMERASEGMIAQSDLMQVALGGIAKGLKPEQLINLADAAKTLGDTVGKTATVALQELTEALETGRTRSLKTYLGTTLDLEAAFGDLASKMTAADKAQAMYSMTMLEASKIQAQQTSVVDSAADDIERLEAKWNNLTTTISRALKSIAVGLFTLDNWQAGAAASLGIDVDDPLVKMAKGGVSIKTSAEIKKANEAVITYQKQIDELKKRLTNRHSGASGKSGSKKDDSMFGENSLQGTPLMRQLIEMEELYDRQFKEMEESEKRDLDLKEKQKALLESIKTPFEEYNEQVALANELMQAGLLTADQYDRAMAKAREVFKDTTAQETESMKALQQAIEGWGRESADAIVEFCVEGKTSFSDMIKSMIKDMLKMMVYQNLMKPLFGGDGQTGWIQSGVSLIGSLFGGGYSDPNTPGMFARGAAFNRGRVTAFANGGVVSRPTLFPMANGMGLMGEESPGEAVMPLKRTSSGKLGVIAEGGGMTISVPVTINGDASKGMAAKLSRAIEETVRKTVKDLM
jgi:hypothetical protein